MSEASEGRNYTKMFYLTVIDDQVWYHVALKCGPEAMLEYISVV